MTRPKLYIFLVAAFLAMLSSSLSLYAAPENKVNEKHYKKADLLAMTVVGEDGEKEDVNVLALIGLDKTNEITTDDDKKSFTGNAENGTKISATVYVPAGRKEWKAAKSYSAKVGASGLFHISVDFNLGENIVVIKATKGDSLSQRAFTVERKEETRRND